MGRQAAGKQAAVASFLILVIAVIGCLVLSAGGAGDPGPPAPTPEQLDARRTAAQTEMEALIKARVVRKVDLNRRTVWIDPLNWAAVDRDVKMGVLVGLADHMEGLTGSYTVTVRSYSNDARLGTFSQIGGAEILQ